MSDELNYYRSKLDELTGQVIKADSVVSRAKRELGQRRKALTILSVLQKTVRADMLEGEVARLALTSAAQALKMDRTVLLAHDGRGNFSPTHTLGYPAAEDPIAIRPVLSLPPELQVESGAKLVTAAASVDGAIATIRDALKLPYFVAAPVLAGKRCSGLIVSGRLREQKPFFPPLDDGDLATWQSVAGFLGSSLLNSELFARTKAMADSFARFVPREFLDLLGKDDLVNIAIGDQTHLEMTILFSDIRGFTTLSEKMTPEETFAFVNTYLAHAAPIIRENHGFIDKYIGDAIMALFPGSPLDAINAGIALRQAVEVFNAAPSVPGMSHIAVGVGVHTGHVMLGTTGFEGRLDCTVIADAVNLASRLEGLTKYYGASLIASMDAMKKIPEVDRPEYRLVDRVRVKGKTDPVELIDVISADPPVTRNLKRQTFPEFSAALTEYAAGRLDAADTLLASVLEQHPEDKTAHLLASRIAHYRTEGLPENWEGIVQLDAK